MVASGRRSADAWHHLGDEQLERSTLVMIGRGLEPKEYPSNTPMVTAVGNGEIEVGLTNHYYLFRLKAEGR